MNGQLSRGEREDLQRQDVYFLARPLMPGLNPFPWRPICVTQSGCCVAADRAPCADTVAHITNLFERSVPEAAHRASTIPAILVMTSNPFGTHVRVTPPV